MRKIVGHHMNGPLGVLAGWADGRRDGGGRWAVACAKAVQVGGSARHPSVGGQYAGKDPCQVVLQGRAGHGGTELAQAPWGCKGERPKPASCHQNPPLPTLLPHLMCWRKEALGISPISEALT